MNAKFYQAFSRSVKIKLLTKFEGTGYICCSECHFKALKLQGRTKQRSALNLQDDCAENEGLNSSCESTTSEDSVEIKLTEIGELIFLYRTSQVLNDAIGGSKKQINKRFTNFDSLANVEFESLVSCIPPALRNLVFFMTKSGDE